VIDQALLHLHHVADRDHRKIQRIGAAAGRVDTARPGGAFAAADDVGADHPIDIGVKGLARPDHAVPPAGVAVLGVVDAGGVMIAGEGVADQDGIGALGIGLAIGFKGHRHRAQGVARFEHQGIIGAAEGERLGNDPSD
jgi:hypothetical protein